MGKRFSEMSQAEFEGLVEPAMPGGGIPPPEKLPRHFGAVRGSFSGKLY